MPQLNPVTRLPLRVGAPPRLNHFYTTSTTMGTGTCTDMMAITLSMVNLYNLGDNVQVLCKCKWYPATVIKCYKNHMWDVEYPPPADQVFCKRLPTTLLRRPPNLSI